MTHHAPNEVKIAAFYHEKEKKQWDWMRWLPHVWDEQRSMRFLSENQQDAQKLAEVLFTPLTCVESIILLRKRMQKFL